MNLEHFRSRFEKLSKLRELNYFLGERALNDEIIKAEKRLGVSFPEQVKLFYAHFNGLKVSFPQLEIFPVEGLKFTFPHKLYFGLIDNNQPIFFDTSGINEAEQWNIISEDGFCMTLTMASFWSNKIWAWIKDERTIWKEEFKNSFR